VSTIRLGPTSCAAQSQAKEQTMSHDVSARWDYVSAHWHGGDAAVGC